MTYKQIIERVAVNVGIDHISQKFITILKRDIYDVVNTLIRKGESLKAVYEVEVNEGEAPANTLTLAEGDPVALGGSGTRKYKLSYTTTQGETDLSSSSADVSTNGDKEIDISDIPIKPTGVTAVNIYRTVTDGSTYYLVTAITDDSTTYTDTVSDATLTSNDQAPSESTEDDPLDMPSDFFFPVEVLMVSTSNKRYYIKEVTYETLLKWSPNVELTTESFTELVTDAEPQEMTWTQENEDLDGYIGYAFTDENPQRLKFKPQFTGTIKVYHAEYPTTAISSLSSSPSIHALFHEAVVNGVTLKNLSRMLLKVETDGKRAGLLNNMRIYKDEFNQNIADFAGFTQKTAETARVEPFDFLNDDAMLL